MTSAFRIVGIVFVFVCTWIAWTILGTVTTHRTDTQSERLGDDVNTLWGKPQAQAAPTFTHVWLKSRTVERTETEGGRSRTVQDVVVEEMRQDVSPASSDIAANVRLDQRLRGLMWYSLYDIDFDAKWTYQHEEATAGTIAIAFRFPDPAAVYDDFHFVLNGQDLSTRLHPKDGALVTDVAVKKGDKLSLAIAYKTRGRDQWSYVPVHKDVDGLRAFNMKLTTDFKDIDFPVPSMSPSSRQETNTGHALSWTFTHVYTGQVMGVVTPRHIQPGELAASLSYSAPVSLMFFFLILFVLSVLRKLDIHPVNYLFIAGAFFSFQLLFAYLTDRMPMWASFSVASIISIALVTSYLRLVVSPRFAFVEAACAQLVYQVGFALAHFFDGYTGLTVTILATLTLGLLMQLTGRIKWSEVFSPVGVLNQR